MWDVSQRKLDYGRKRVENERARERNREGGSGINWKVEKKKRRGWDIWVYVCGA